MWFFLLLWFLNTVHGSRWWQVTNKPALNPSCYIKKQKVTPILVDVLGKLNRIELMFSWNPHPWLDTPTNVDRFCKDCPAAPKISPHNYLSFDGTTLQYWRDLASFLLVFQEQAGKCFPITASNLCFPSFQRIPPLQNWFDSKVFRNDQFVNAFPLLMFRRWQIFHLLINFI